MKRVDPHILREALLPFVLLLVLSVALLVANRLLKVLPLLFEVNVAFGEVAGIFLWLVPSFLLFALPIATWVAWVVAYGRMGTDGELVAWSSVGVSPGRLLRPGTAVGLALVATALVVAQYGYGQGRLRFHQGMEELARNMALKAVQPGTMVQLGDDLWVGVAKPEREGENPPVYVIREPDLVLAAGSATPLTDAPGLALTDGLAFARAGTDPAAVSFAAGTASFAGMGMGEFRPGAREQDLTTLWHDPANISYTVELHQRLALATSLLLVPFGAFLLAPRRTRSGRSNAVLHALLGLGGYYGLFTAGKQVALKEWVHPGLGVWGANAAALVLILWFFRRKLRRPGLP